MKMAKKFLPAVILAMILVITGCGQGAEETDRAARSDGEQEESTGKTEKNPEETLTEDDMSEASEFVLQFDTFYSHISDSAHIDDAVELAGGHVQSGIIKTGDLAVLVQRDGTGYETVVEKIVLYGEENTPVKEAGEGSLALVWLEMIERDQMYGALLLGTSQWNAGIPIDFPFERTEEYSLALSPVENTDKQGEFRLYDGTGEVLQRIPYGTFREPVYSVVYKNDRRNLVFFPDKESNAGRFLEWRDGRFSELETDIKRRQKGYLSDELLITEESETDLIREIYRTNFVIGFQGNSFSEKTRNYHLKKETGELEIADCLDGQILFRGRVPLREDGTPVNGEYYELLFVEDSYDLTWNDNEDDEDSVWVDVCNLKSANGKMNEEYESREAFLTAYGLEDCEPIYRYYDRLHNLRLELYRNEAADLFCGVKYGYYYNSKRQKCTGMTGFAIDDIVEEEWKDDTYPLMSSTPYPIEKYEESIEYTSDKRVKHFLAKGLDKITTDTGGIVNMLEFNYEYRDDGTLYYRYYWHNSYQFGTFRCVERSFYDEKERLIYENAYITHGTLEDYYVYLDGGGKPAYHLQFDYAGGPAPNAYMERYQ